VEITMKRVVVVVVALAVLMPSIGAQNAPRGWTTDLIMKVKRIPAVVPSPDGTRVAYVVSEAQMEGEKSEFLSQIHVAAADGSGGFQLTRGDKSATSPRWSPDGQWIAFLSSRGDTKTQIFRIRVAGGEAEPVTAEKGSVAGFEWSPDGKTFAFLMTDPRTDEDEKAAKEKRDARVIDENEKVAGLYVVAVEKGADGKRTSKRLTPAAMHVTGVEWSPDSSTLVFSHAKTIKVFDQTDISTVAAAGGAPKAIAATPASESNAVYSPDGRSIAYAASDNPPTWAGTAWVRVVPASGGTPRDLAKTFDEQPTILAWSPDNRAVYVAETHGTIARIASLPADGGAQTWVSPADANVNAAAIARSGVVGFVQSWPDQAPEPFVARLQPFAAKQIASVQKLPPAAEAPIGKTEVLRWKSPDGTDVEGLLTYPVGYEKGRRVPLLVLIHGGPTGVFTRGFIGMPGPYPMPVWAAKGYAMLRVNPRGSSGYGRTFRYANLKDWGGGDYKDNMSGVDHVIALGVADPDRMGVMGWSYGGYMTSWVVTQTKRFKAASVGAGVTNLMSFTGVSDIPGFVPDYFGGDYWDVFDSWRTHSAMFNVKGVTTPTLIQHGEQDLRVPISQGYEFYNALKRQNVPVKMVVYPRQPHGIQEPKLIKDAMERNLEWFDRWLGAKPTTTSTR
jgi:dipeptidyl aminopeptidase/acylaminoacyl peptidase